MTTTGSGYHENRGHSVLVFSATPIFDGSAGTTFVMTLTGNVTSSTFINGVSGQIYHFLIKQDSNGLHSFAWPTNAKGVLSIPITATASTAAAQSFIYDSASGNLYATSGGLLNI